MMFGGSPSHQPDSTSRIKVLVVGEAGVGKSTLVQAICGHPGKSAPWTVGCTVDVIVHPFRAGTQQERPFFVELWDVGGSRSHRNARRVFYQGTSGLILVHDLGNRKSEETLHNWLSEVSGFGSLEAVVSSSSSTPQGRLPTQDTSASLPTLVVGSKADHCPGDPATLRDFKRLNADDHITMDCRQPITPGSTNRLKFAKFFDRVIEEYCRKTPGMSSLAPSHSEFSHGLFDRSTRRLY